ncbi:hypothetical protein FZEAL_5037 [Fusarium zealandicum]|uniref:Glyoxalase-like domain-containing protein n=1 Tax=Fusarium zealandicum TaxID=1053134 RepID=A0A8H4XK72_9HYPO|nr:hypothetical protein FZEAL_5037 [Fusarium zealandicum]
MSDSTSLEPILDHIVVLVSYETLQELPKRLDGLFTVIDGGAHVEGRTVNKLIIFPDGVYMELIAFQENLDPERRREHRWGELEEGEIIDWAYTLPEEKDFAVIQQQVKDADDAISYRDPVPGGRTRPDGVELKWSVASAEESSGKPLPPGTAPFWCLDRTPRHLRVPYQQEGSAAPSYTKHPAHALGVSRVAISVPESDVSVLTRVYDGIHGASSQAASGGAVWSFAVPSGSTQGKHELSLSTSQDQERHIAIVFVGDEDSPYSIYGFPGLTFECES